MEPLQEILSHFQVGMLVTHAEDASMHARPMKIAAHEGDGVLWFLSRVDSQKIIELGGDARATVVFMDADEERFLSLTGFAGATTERARIESLWNESFRTWFPRGPSDPNLCAVYFEPTEAEFWDRAETQEAERSIQWNH